MSRGFDHKLTDDQWESLIGALHREVARYVPEWTDQNFPDPGVTLMELIVFLTEELLYRAHPSVEQRSTIARALLRIANRITCETTLAPGESRDGLLRVNYFAGQLLGADDLVAEQDYMREKLRRANRRYGVGIVTGLDVSIDRKNGRACVVISPGMALDARGEEIELNESVALELPKRGKALFVQVRYAERLCRPVPALGTDPSADAPRYSRIEESFDASLATAADACAVSLARVAYVRARWALDRRFKPPRAGARS